MLVIALTGGIGSGKTTVSEIFKAINIPIIDTDVIARQIVQQDTSVYAEIVKLFGKEILRKDKEIDRKALRELVFSSQNKRSQLENILHPLIWEEVTFQLTSIKADSPPYCVVVVPLLLENPSQIKPVDFDRILVIDVEEEIQLKRANKRDKSDELTIKKIIKSQVSRQVRIDAADDIILNTDDLDSLKSKVEYLHNQYLKFSNN